MTNANREEALNILKSMGEWEHVVRLLTDLRVGGTQPKIDYEFGHDLYDIGSEIDSYGILTVRFFVKSEVALLRVNDQFVDLDVEEIWNQITNIPKWLNLVHIVGEISSVS